MKKLILFVFGLLIVGTVNALPLVDNLTVNDSDGIFMYGDSYQFNATVYNITNESWGNITDCTINGVSMTGPGGNGTGLWQYNGTVNSFGMEDNCTYTTLIVNCTFNTSQTCTTTNSSWTMLPCVESTNVSLTSALATADSLTFVVNDSLASTSVVWVIPQTITGNSTHGQCNYRASNNRKLSIQAMIVNITAGFATPYCNLTITRNASDTGSVVAQVETLISRNQPSSIPAAALAALTVLVMFSHFVSTRTDL